MTAVLDRVPVETITARAREIRFGRSLLAVVAGVLFGVGWLVGKTFMAVWFALAWSATAVKIGWQEARTPGAARREPA